MCSNLSNKITDIQYITIRVYGLLINENNEILLSDEFALGKKITKFPGGGLEPGEGTIDALKREFCEEFNQDIEIIEHFYTTDFFQNAFSLNNYQIISIYYLINLSGKKNINISKKAFDKQDFKPGDQTVRFVKINKKLPEIITLPIDKIVAKKLLKKFNPKNK